MSLLRIAENVQCEQEVQKSRFVGRLIRVESELDARNELTAIRKEFWQANHHCSAWIIGESAEFQRSNDDGEPSGTAGLPILEVLRRSNLTDVLAVVTRYFGGTLLGTGGLIRAYGGCVRDAVQQAHLVERRMLAVVRFEVDHAIAGRLTSLLHASEFPDVAFEYQADRVVGTIHLDQETTSDFERWVAEQTNGTAITEIIGETWREVLVEKAYE